MSIVVTIEETIPGTALDKRLRCVAARYGPISERSIAVRVVPLPAVVDGSARRDEAGVAFE